MSFVGCPSENELALLLDGEATINAAGELRAHLVDCASCRNTWNGFERLARDLRAPTPAVEVERAVERLMLSIDAESAAPARVIHATRLPMAVVIAASLALVAGVAALAWNRRPAEDRADVLAARGSSADGALGKMVGVSFYRVDAALHPLAAGNVVPASAKLTISYRNLRGGNSTYLLAFAVDTQGTVHWLFPGYEQAGDNPESIALAPSQGDILMSTSVVLDRPSRGPLRLVSLVTSSPRHVRDIESLAPGDLTALALGARWSDAAVNETVVLLVEDSP